MEDVILTSMKDYLGISDIDKAFDNELILHINTAFSNIFQIGVDENHIPKRLNNGEETWTELFSDYPNELSFIKEYTFLKVKLLFDPPTNSSLLDSLTKLIQESEYRLQIQLEGFFKEDDNADNV